MAKSARRHATGLRRAAGRVGATRAGSLRFSGGHARSAGRWPRGAGRTVTRSSVAWAPRWIRATSIACRVRAWLTASPRGCQNRAAMARATVARRGPTCAAANADRDARRGRRPVEPGPRRREGRADRAPVNSCSRDNVCSVGRGWTIAGRRRSGPAAARVAPCPDGAVEGAGVRVGALAVAAVLDGTRRCTTECPCRNAPRPAGDALPDQPSGG